MLVKEGYKQTPIGIIPDDWDVVSQSEVATFYNGRAYKLSEWEESGVPVIRLQNLTGSGKEYYYSKLKLPEHQYCNNGDLLYMWSATFGPVWWTGDKAIFHYHIWKIQTIENRLDKDFLYYLLDDVTVRMKNQSHGSTMLHVTKGGMEKLNIQLPPLSEQQKIAEILSTVDNKLAAIQSEISATETLKKGLMQTLLTQGIGHTKFKDSPLGQIPESWVVRDVQDVTDYVDYRGKTPTKTSSGIFLVTARNIKNNRIDYDISQEFIAEGDYEIVMSRGTPKIGDVLLTTEAPMGSVAMVDREGIALAQRIIKYRGHPGIIDNSYLRYCFISHYFQNLLDLNSTGSTVKGIKGSRLKKLNILIPPLEEQTRIAEILATVDNKLDTLATKKIQYQALKKGLMQKLLTGEVRVRV